MKKFIVFISIICCSIQMYAQQKTQALENFASDFTRQISRSWPRQLADSIGISFIFMRVNMVDGKVKGDPEFSANTEYGIKMALRDEKEIINRMRWKDAFPEIALDKPFKILIPVFYYRLSSSNKIDGKTIDQILTKAFDLVKKSAGPVYLVPVISFGYSSSERKVNYLE